MAETRDRYAAEIDTWREGMERSLRREEGWLSLVGLHWLRPGSQRAGFGPGWEIELPGFPGLGSLGAFIVSPGGVRFEAAPGAEVTLEGEPVTELDLRPDTSGSPTRLRSGSLTMVLIQRGERLGLRVWDRDSPARSAFAGRQWFPIDPAWCVDGRFEGYQRPKPMRVPDMAGGEQTLESPGEIVFNLGARPQRLIVSEHDDDGLFVVFSDRTAGVSTYPAGRYLYAAPPAGGAVTIDFNRAYNPPCAFTPYATCPLPPPGNRLDLAIEAGERFRASAE